MLCRRASDSPSACRAYACSACIVLSLASEPSLSIYCLRSLSMEPQRKKSLLLRMNREKGPHIGNPQDCASHDAPRSGHIWCLQPGTTLANHQLN